MTTNTPADPDWPPDRVSRLMDITPQFLGQLVEQGVITRVGPGKYNPFACNVAYIRHLRDGLSNEAKENKARKLKAEAELAEMASAKASGQLVERYDYETNYRDLVARGSMKISRLTNLTKEQKESVLQALREVQLDQLEGDAPNNQEAAPQS